MNEIKDAFKRFLRENSTPGFLVTAIVLYALVPKMREITLNLINGKYYLTSQYLVYIDAILMTTFLAYFFLLVVLAIVLPKRSWIKDEALTDELNRCITQFSKLPIVIIHILAFVSIVDNYHLCTSMGTVLGYGLILGMAATVVLLLMLIAADKGQQPIVQYEDDADSK